MGGVHRGICRPVYIQIFVSLKLYLGGACEGMYEYETFVYLDVQKTGSSFISAIFRRFCSERCIRSDRHKSLARRWDYDPDKLHIISIRDPLDTYISLYSFGCGHEGLLFRHLSKTHRRLYDHSWGGFQQWLDLLLEPENAPLLVKDGEPYPAANLIGFQSARMLQMSMWRGEKKLQMCKTADDVRRGYQKLNIVNYTIRNETLREDMANLIDTRLRHAMKDADAAIRFVRNAEPIMVSERVDTKYGNARLSPKRAARLREREWPMYEFFNYPRPD
jgi:Sulfotransferase family